MAIQLSGSLAITGSLVATSQIIAQTLNVQQVTSSIVYSSGSNIFGNSVSNTQQFTGSLQVSSSTSYILGNVGIGTTSPFGTTANRTVLSVNGTTDVSLNVGSGGTQRAYLYGSSTYADLGTIGSLPLTFSPNNTERVRITSGGNVGIGTTTPNSTLQVSKGGVTFQVTDTNKTANNTLSIYGLTQTSFAIATGNSGSFSGGEKIVINDNGNIGIGTTNPTRRLYVTATSGEIARFDGSGYAADSAAEIDVLGPQSNGQLNVGIGGSTFVDSTNNIQNKGFITTGTGLTGLNLRSDAGFVQITAGGVAASNEVARFTAAGNVGIGTTTPGYKLDVSGGTVRVQNNPSTNEWGLFLQNTNTGGWGVSQFFNLYGYASSPASDFTVLQLRADYPAYGRVTFAVKEQAQSTAVDALTLRGNGQVYMNAGNVGIGTTSPSARLHVEGNTILNGNVSANTTYNAFALNVAGIAYIIGGSVWVNDAYGYANASSVNTGMYPDSSHNITFKNNNSTSVYINSSRNVGIGTTNPYGRLHLTGNYDGAQNTLNLENNWPNTHRTSLINFWAYYNSTNPQAVIEAGQDVSATNAGVIEFKTMLAGAAPATRMIIKPNGNVGIGTTNPLVRLHVGDGSQTAINGASNKIHIATTGTRSALLTLANSSGGTTVEGQFESSAESADLRIIIGSTTNHDVVFRTNNAERMRITNSGTIQPGANGTQDLGTSSLRWATVFTSDLDMSNGIGDYTIVEGEEDLFLYNNKTNKVFKFLIQEVDPSTAPPKKIRN